MKSLTEYRAGAALLAMVLSANAAIAAEQEIPVTKKDPPGTVYRERYRPQFHFTPQAGYSGTGDYDIGTFDGHQFTKESGTHPYAFANMKRGGFFYASQTWNNAPDGRRIQIATCWTKGGVPADMPFSQGMFFPVSLSLSTTPDGLRMCPWPVAEIEKLYDKKHEWRNLEVTSTNRFAQDVSGELFDVELAMIPSPEASVEITVGGAVISTAGSTRPIAKSSRTATRTKTTCRPRSRSTSTAAASSSTTSRSPPITRKRSIISSARPASSGCSLPIGSRRGTWRWP